MQPFAFLLAVLSATAFAQSPSPDGTRGSLPPGSAADGSRPQDGAIQGGSILPGERGGVPESAPATRIERCQELSGRLREQCLLKEERSGTGPSRAPEVGGTQPTPGTPPPQNPR